MQHPLPNFPPAKIVFTLICLISISGFLLCASLVRHRGAIFKENDPLGYYVYARSIVHDGDIDFSNELHFFNKTNTRFVSGVGVFNERTGRYTNQYTIGFPLLVLPFYGTFSTIASHFFRERFDWFLDQIIFCTGSILLGILGIWLSYKFVSYYFSPQISLLSTAIFWVCSPVIFYFIFESYLSHLASIFAVSAFLCLWKAESLSMNKRAILMGLMAGIIAMIRQQEVLVILIPISFAVFSPNFSLRLIAVRQILLCVASFLLTFSIQMIVWKILTGSFVVYSYSQSGQSFDFSAPKVFDVLFSSNHGLLVWHPIFLICLAGLIFSRTLSRAAKIAFLIAFLCQLYVTSSWSMWWMGHSFGNRAFLGLTPIFILGLAAFLKESLQVVRLRTLLAILILLSIWNGVLILGYVSDMIPHQGVFSWLEFVKKIPELPVRIREKIDNL
ncbi:glycosyltransferase family 39 protein [bacterium]|nr:glycosyltransferase family 39 protein [bacterium]